MEPPIDLDAAPAPHPHRTLRERVAEALGEHTPPAFAPTEPDEPAGLVLRAALALAVEADLVELDIDREPVGATWHNFASGAHCSLRGVAEDGAVTSFCSNWSPVGHGEAPRTGFGDGPDSSLLGHFGRTVMPDDWRTDALLLLVTTPYLHLSVDRRAEPPLVRGALQDTDETRYVELMNPTTV